MLVLLVLHDTYGETERETEQPTGQDTGQDTGATTPARHRFGKYPESLAGG